jgi:hypothetical protein
MICVDQPERASYSPADVYMDPQLLLLQPLPPFDVTLPTTLVYSVACPVPFSTGPAYPGTALPHPAATLRTGKEVWEGVWCQDESHLSHMRHSQLSRLTEAVPPVGAVMHFQYPKRRSCSSM